MLDIDAAVPRTLDPRQLRRIEAVHRGFLYQHLYAVWCLLLAGPSGIRAVVVESDEDIELETDKGCIYVQVKTRVGALARADVDDALARFAQIRAEHTNKSRSGDAYFVIASNAAPNGPLAAMLRGPGWPKDVELHWPSMEGGPRVVVPKPAMDIAEAIERCSFLADSLPHALLVPETLVWKLAGQVMLAASGTPPRTNHRFTAEELPVLFEQLVLQLQDFPAPPAVYRPQKGEPSLVSDAPVRIVAGYSGAGKTAWAAAAAQQTPEQLAYFDVGDTPGPALAMSLARELAARWLGSKGGRLGEVLLPGASGLDLLQALGRQMEVRGERVTLVLDNAHRLPPADLLALISRVPWLRVLLLCHPGEAVRELQIMLDVKAERLEGWDADAVAAEAQERCCRADFATCERLRRLTGALPYYVQNALSIAQAEYDGDLAALCTELEAQTHIVETAQEIILERTFAAATPELRDILSVLSIADVPISGSEARAVLRDSLSLDDVEVARRLRGLPATGAMELFGGDRLKVHDAMRLVTQRHLIGFGPAEVERVRRVFADVIVASIQEDWSLGKLSLLIRLFGQVGRATLLVEFATDELFHEMGVWPEIEPFLVRTAEGDGDPEQRCRALDGLIFNDLREGKSERALERLGTMGRLIERHGIGDQLWLNWAMKRMLALAQKSNGEAVAAAIEEMRPRVPKQPEYDRIFRYNVANAFFRLGEFKRTTAETGRLITEYYDALGIDPELVFGRNADELRPLLPERPGLVDDLKHLADTLDLHAQAITAQGGVSPFGRIHALKFYQLAHAPDSMLRVGQELVDEFCGRNDFQGARDLIERNLLPLVQGLRLAGHMIPVRSQYAVVLAYCGAWDEADAEMARLLPYHPGMSEAGQKELMTQHRLIAELRRHGPPSQLRVPQVTPPWMRESVRSGKRPGRNELCPCGSGKKFKRCHGV
ncbi:SEC-C metal-binding domain-containing protein [Azospirillum sp.]|uniref:SEC-C metal-binding domain-containing protein n=1 Tax=Azospirillum sp. TaxID=34012 RepID=UPI002D24E6EF|nr:SEC-C metal-binding domain-containing protein [Azospirillum sp.]HYF87127.1 SEC-C metal-binding domain-containing protein [Azospirillum sp.]